MTRAISLAGLAGLVGPVRAPDAEPRPGARRTAGTHMAMAAVELLMRADEELHAGVAMSDSLRNRLLCAVVALCKVLREDGADPRRALLQYARTLDHFADPAIGKWSSGVSVALPASELVYRLSDDLQDTRSTFLQRRTRVYDSVCALLSQVYGHWVSGGPMR